MATAELQSSLQKFAVFARSLKGDEKSEAQTFLNEFSRALGHENAVAAGATFEFHVVKKRGLAKHVFSILTRYGTTRADGKRLEIEFRRSPTRDRHEDCDHS